MENQINSLRKEIEVLLKDFFAKKLGEAEKLSPIYFDLVNQIAKMTLSGGKRIRPILVYYGYKSIREPKTKISDQKILSFSLCTELFQTACLIHDDIMDNAKSRRGELTIQRYFEKKYDKKLAENLSILAGDLALVWADELFHATNISVEAINNAQPIYNKLRSEVIFGQTCDLVLNNKAQEQDILTMYEYKTARYSFARPLQLGASLAGATEANLKKLENYAIPVGIAFQIQDDILGSLGEATGKDSDSDIKEGKETLLVHKTKQLTDNSKQLTILDNILGNQKASEEDIDWVRDLIKESGALKYCHDKAEKLIKEAKKTLNNSPFSPETKNFLVWLADFCIARRA